MIRKITFILVFVVTTTFLSSAQIQKGRWMLNGNATLAFNSFHGDSNFSSDNLNLLVLNPGASYFMTNNLALGLDAGLLYGSAGNLSATLFSIAPTLSYYFDTRDHALKPFLNVNAGYGNLSMKLENAGDGSTGIFSVGGKGGILYLIRPNIGLQFGAGYNRYFSTEEDGGSFGAFGLNVGFSLFF